MTALVLLMSAAMLFLPNAAAGAARAPWKIGVVWDIKTVPPAVIPLSTWLADDLQAHGLAATDFRLLIHQGTEPGDFRQAVRQLLREQVDVIWTSTTAPALVAKDETSSVPIVFGVAEDADHVGLVERPGRPGGNLTGVSIQQGVLAGKRLELLKEMVPRLRRVLMPIDPTASVTPSLLQEARAAARHLALVLIEAPLATRDDLTQLPALITRQHVDGVCHVVNTAVNAQPELVVTAINRARLPDISYYLPAVERGWSMAAYAPSHRAAWKASARLVARIVRGSRPRDLPVESPDVFEFHVNLRVANARGISVPQGILARANKVFEH